MSNVNAKAAELFAAGESTNAVAKALFNGNWGTANKLRKAWEAGDIDAVVDGRKTRSGGGKRKATEQAVEVEPEPEASELPDVWDVTVGIPRDQVDAIFGQFTPHEKAHAVSAVLEARWAAQLGV